MFSRKVLLPIAMLLLAACDTSDSGVAGGTNVEIKPPLSNDKVVCTPFNGADPSLPYNGLMANLLYLSDDQPRYSTAVDYMNNAHKADVTLFLNNLSIPTRPFDQGFVTQAGNTIVNEHGNTLYEYFALHMESFLMLREGDAEGDYQLALLADDGALVTMDDVGNGNFRTIVNDDGTHPTRMACATEPIHMTRSTMLPIKVEYYQGPRMHIALTMIWKPWTGVNDPACGTSGNSLFWDSTQTPSAPTGFSGLLARGWAPLASENYRLPSSMNSNPCAPATDVLISNFSIVNVGSNVATLQWDTNVPSDSLVTYQVAGSSAAALTSYDATPTLNHSVTLSGLSNFTLYNVFVTSAAGGKNASNAPSTYKTQR